MNKLMNKLRLKKVLMIFVATVTVVWSINILFTNTNSFIKFVPEAKADFWANSISPMGGGISTTFSGEIYFSGAINTDTVTYNSGTPSSSTVLLLTGRYDDYQYFSSESQSAIGLGNHDVETLSIDATNAAAGQLGLSLTGENTLATSTTYTILVKDVCQTGHTAAEENHWQYCAMWYQTFTTTAGEGGATYGVDLIEVPGPSNVCSGSMSLFAGDTNQGIYSFNAYGDGTLDFVKIYSVTDPSSIVDQVKIYRDKTSSNNSNGNWMLEPGTDTLIGSSSSDWTLDGAYYLLTVTTTPAYTLPTSDPNGSTGFITFDIESDVSGGAFFSPTLLADSFVFSGTDDANLTTGMNSAISSFNSGCSNSLITITSSSQASDPYIQNLAPTASMSTNATGTVLGIDFWEAGGAILSSINVDVMVPSGSGFDPQYGLVDLAANSADAGINIYQDNKSAGTQGSFDANDTLLQLSATPSWTTLTGTSKRATLSLNSSINLPASNSTDGVDYFIVIRTSSSPAAGSSFYVRIPTNGFVTNFPTSDSDSSTINIQSGGGMTATGVLISEIQAQGGATGDEFVELYNPTNAAVDLSSYSIQYRLAADPGTFSKQDLSSTSTIPAYGFFLLAPDTYDGTPTKDVGNDNFTDMVLVGGTVFLVNNQTILETGNEATIIDQVAWGAGANLVPEGEAMSAPSANGSIERKSWYQATAGDMAPGGMDENMGNMEDTDYNFMDFVTQAASVPQSTASAVENPMENQEGGTAGTRVVINEVYYYPASGQTAWIELYNRSTTTQDMSGWKITTDSQATSTSIYTFAAGDSITSGSYATVWWKQTGTDTVTNFYTSGSDGTSVTTDMSSLAGDITLDDGSAIKDYVQYGAINQPGETNALNASPPEWVNDHYVPSVLRGQSFGRSGTGGSDNNRDDDWQTFSSPSEGTMNSGGDSFAPDPVTGVTLTDGDTSTYGISGEDVTVTWTPNGTTDPTFEKYLIYILPAATALNVTNHTPFTQIYSGQTIATFTGRPGNTQDSNGDALDTGSYRAYVVAQDTAGNRSSAAASSIQTLTSDVDEEDVGTDSQMPMIMHMGVWQAQVGKDIVLIARFDDDRSLSTPQVVWDEAADENSLNLAAAAETPTNCAAIGGTSYYSCTIAAANVGNVGHVIGYYLKVADSVSNLALMSASPSVDMASYDNNTLYETAVQDTPFIIDILAASNYIDSGNDDADLTGTVYASNGSALQNAYVFIEGTGIGTAATDASGVFSFGDDLIMPGSLPTAIFKSGYMDMYGSAFKGESNLVYYMNSGETHMGPPTSGGGGGYMEMPMVTYSNPYDGMFGAPTQNFAMTLGFSKSMDANTITDNDASNAGSHVYLTTDGTDRVSGTVSYNSGTNEATFAAGAGTTLIVGTTYTLVITTAVTDTLGNSVSGGWRSDGAFEITFTTQMDNSNMWGTDWEDYMSGGDMYGGTMGGGGEYYAGMDFSGYGQGGQQMPPYVVGTTPQPGSTGISNNASIIIEFSEPMSASTIDANSVVLYPITDTSAWTPDNTAITATVSLDSATQQIVTLDPDENLDLNSPGDGWYVLKIMGSVQSVNGVWYGDPRDCGSTDPNTCLASTSEYEMSFQLNTNASTASDTTSPTVTGTYPNNNDGITNSLTVDVGISAIEVGFSEAMNPSTVNIQSVTLQAGSRSVSGKVTYDATAMSAYFVPASALSANTRYTLTASTTITDLAGNQLDQTSTAGLQGKTVEFKTGSADETLPTLLYANADDYSVAITFSEPMNSAKQTDTARWSSSILNPANYYVKTVDSGGTGAGVYSDLAQLLDVSSLSFDYDEPTNTLFIEGFGFGSVANFQVFIDNVIDKSNNIISNSGDRLTGSDNGTQCPIQNSTETYGMLGPGGPGMMMMGPMGGGGPMGMTGGGPSGPGMDMGSMGMMPAMVHPMNMMAGQTSQYFVEFPVTSAIPAGGNIVLTFPNGFNVASAAEDTNSPLNTDINEWGTGTVDIASVTGNQTAKTITVVTQTDATQANDFLRFDLKGIVNSSRAQEFGSEGYSVGIKTFNASGVMLENITTMPFYLQEGGDYTLSGTVTFKQGDGTTDLASNIANGQTFSIFLGSPMTGPMDYEHTFDGTTKSFDYSFASLPEGEYHLFTDSDTITVGVTATDFNGLMNPDTTRLNSGTVTNNVLDKDITISAIDFNSGAALTVSLIGDFTTSESDDNVDIFANSYNTFRVKTVTPGDTTGTNYTLYLPDGDWMIGIGKAMPKGPMSGPAPMPDWMPPMSIDVKVDSSTNPVTYRENSGTANDGTIVFNISGQASNTLTGYVLDGSESAIADAEVYAFQPMGGYGGSFTRTAADGSFTLKFPILGTYKVGSHKPGLPEPKEKTVDVRSDGNYVNGSSIESLIITMKRPSYTISGKVLNASSKAIANVPVWAYQPNAWGHANTMTDSTGNYILYVDDGIWTVEADAPGVGWLQYELPVTINGASQSNINLQPDTDTVWIDISGTISINDTNQVYMPVSASQYTDATPADGIPDYYNGREFGGMTDSSGVYSISVPGGSSGADYKYYEISTWTPDFGMVGLSYDQVASSPANIKISDTATTTANITITSANLNTVTISFGDHKLDYSGDDAFINIEGVSYTGTTPFPTGFHKSIRVADIAGADPTVDLVAGDYHFFVDVPGTGFYMPSKTNSAAYDNTKGCITVDGTSDTLQFDLPDLNDTTAMITISGTVSGPGVGQMDAWVWVGNMATGFHSGMQAASSTGAYSLVVPILSSGTYKIGADKPGFVSGESISNAGTANSVVNITLTAAANTISGNIFTDSGTDDDTYTSGEEIANGWVHAEEINTGAESFAPVDGSGAYSLAVTDGEWKVYGAADGYSETQYVESDIPATVTVSGDSPTANVELPADANWESKTKSSSITPSSGGVVDDTAQDATTGKTSGTGVKLTVPPNALGSDSSAGNVSSAATAAISASDSMKPFAGEGKNITATDNSGQQITSLDNYIDIEIVTYKADVDEQITAGEIVDESKLKTMKIGYWDETLNEWVNEPTTKTVYYKDSADTEWTMYNGTTTDDGFTTGYELFIDEALGDDSTFVEGEHYDDYKLVCTASVNHLTVYAAGTSPDGVAPAAPTALAQTSGAGTSVGLSWTAPTTNADTTALTDLYGYAVYRSTDGATYSQISTSAILSGTTTYTDSSTSAFTSYYYQVTAGDDDDTESARSTALRVCSTNSVDNGSVGADCAITCNSGYTASGNSCVSSGSGSTSSGGGGSYVRPDPPYDTGVKIEGDKASVYSTSVQLKLSAKSANKMMISNDVNFGGAEWESTKTYKTWTLTSGAGTKTVYVKFKNSAGDVSAVVSDSIELLGTTQTPEASLSPKTTQAPTVIEIKVNDYEGQLIKAKDSSAVYLVEAGKKRPILSSGAFGSYGYSWTSVQMLDSVSAFTLGETLRGKPQVRNLVKSDDNKVYFLAPDNIKRWVVSEQVFLALGYEWSDILEIDQTDLDNYELGEDISSSKAHPDGSLVKYAHDVKVYLLQDGKKRWIPSEAIFNEKAYKWGDIIEIPISEVYTDGFNVDGSVLGAKTSRVYLRSFLTLGAYNQEVRWLQDKLKDLGYFSQDQVSTGYYGPITREAVKKFQADYGIEQIGYVGPRTRGVLNSL